MNIWSIYGKLHTILKDITVTLNFNDMFFAWSSTQLDTASLKGHQHVSDYQINIGRYWPHECDIVVTWTVPFTIFTDGCTLETQNYQFENSKQINHSYWPGQHIKAGDLITVKDIKLDFSAYL